MHIIDFGKKKNKYFEKLIIIVLNFLFQLFIFLCLILIIMFIALISNIENKQQEIMIAH